MNEHDEDRRRRQAVALAYGSIAEATPQVVAQGYGSLAELIIREAAVQGVYVHDSPDLVGLLMKLNLDEQVPPRLYRIVAELLVWIGDTLPLEDEAQR